MHESRLLQVPTRVTIFDITKLGNKEVIGNKCQCVIKTTIDKESTTHEQSKKEQRISGKGIKYAATKQFLHGPEDEIVYFITAEMQCGLNSSAIIVRSQLLLLGPRSSSSSHGRRTSSPAAAVGVHFIMLYGFGGIYLSVRIRF